MLSGSETVDAVPDVDNLKVSELVVNWGNNPQPTPNDLDTLAGDLITGQQGSIDTRGWADCDGAVFEQVQTLSGRFLFDQSNNTAQDPNHPDPTLLGSYSWTSHFHGLNSPFYCGAVSNYDVEATAIRRARPFDTAITINPPIASLRVGHTVKFSVENGTPVDWRVNGGAVNGPINGDGVYTMVSNVPANTRSFASPGTETPDAMR